MLAYFTFTPLSPLRYVDYLSARSAVADAAHSGGAMTAAMLLFYAYSVLRRAVMRVRCAYERARYVRYAFSSEAQRYACY